MLESFTKLKETMNGWKDIKTEKVDETEEIEEIEDNATTIKTKFKIGQGVYFLYNDCIINGEITKMAIEVEKYNTIINYLITFNLPEMSYEYNELVDEINVSATRDVLVNKLLLIEQQKYEERKQKIMNNYK